MAKSEVTMPKAAPDCQSVLRTLSFGQRIAEEERDYLANDFVETDQWRRMYSGDVDIVYGAKGSGECPEFHFSIDQTLSNDPDIRLITGENPRGTPVFRDLTTEPPASEREFVALWKLYILSLLGREVLRLDLNSFAALNLVGKTARCGTFRGWGEACKHSSREFGTIYADSAGSKAASLSTRCPERRAALRVKSFSSSHQLNSADRTGVDR